MKNFYTVILATINAMVEKFNNALRPLVFYTREQVRLAVEASRGGIIIRSGKEIVCSLPWPERADGRILTDMTNRARESVEACIASTIEADGLRAMAYEDAVALKNKPSVAVNRSGLIARMRELVDAANSRLREYARRHIGTCRFSQVKLRLFANSVGYVLKSGRFFEDVFEFRGTRTSDDEWAIHILAANIREIETGIMGYWARRVEKEVEADRMVHARDAAITACVTA